MARFPTSKKPYARRAELEAIIKILQDDGYWAMMYDVDTGPDPHPELLGKAIVTECGSTRMSKLGIKMYSMRWVSCGDNWLYFFEE